MNFDRLSVGWNSGSGVNMAGTDAVIGRWDVFAPSPVFEYTISGE